MIAGSWPAGQAPIASVTNTDGSVTYTFALGDLTANQAAAPLTFQVGIGTRITMPATLTVTAVINSDGDPRAASFRTDTADLVVNTPAAFVMTKLASSSFAIPGVPVTYSVSWLNGLENPVGVGKIVDILPFSGDGRGTDGLPGLSLDAVSVNADMAVAIEYTTDASASVMAAVNGDRSGDTGISWNTLASGANPPSNATALRFVTANILPGKSGEAQITVTPGALAASGAVVNDVSGVVELIAQPIANVAAVQLPSGAVSLSGTVYDDVDYSGALTSGDAGLAGVRVIATGYTFGPDGIDDSGSGDDQTVTAADAPAVTTAADGTYTLDGLAPGSWTVAVDGAVSGMVPAEVPGGAVALQPTETATDLNLGFVVPIPAPVLVDDTARVSAGDTVDITVLGNDTVDPSAAITQLGTPTAGTVTQSNGVVTYTAGSTPGSETFTYTVTDKMNQSATATVTVQVVAVPTASDTAVTIGQESTPIDLAGLFTGDSAAISTTAEGTSVAGTVVTYTPAEGFFGTTSFEYTVTDSLGKTTTGTVTVTVVRAPELADDSASTTNVAPVTVAVTDNDPFVGTGTLVVASGPVHGTAQLSGTGIVYTPDAGFAGTDTFTYTVTDSLGQTDTATVTVTVADVLALTDDSAHTGPGTAVTVDVLGNDTATDGVIASVTQGTNGTVEVVDGQVVYTPVEGFLGGDTFSYTVTDSIGQTGTATVTVAVVEPIAVAADSARTGEETAVTVDVLANDVATEGQITAVTQGANGAVVITNGQVVYTPAAGFAGTDTFTYTVTDLSGATATANVTITVIAQPTGQGVALRTGLDTAVSVDLGALATGDGLTLAVTTQGADGTATVDEGVLTYTPNTGFVGNDQVVLTWTDSVGQTVEVTVTIEVVDA
ncbi:Ig-like domain-containing protein, partial [Cellulomonas sp. NPDC089187]|uniref:beta strand repeat-containing protein n=1 Tax=Cellulomonas sp. NPDC089187 TaxID=3154970 RepID=UPI00343A8B14